MGYINLALLPQYILRGWDLLPYSYVNLLTGEVCFISQEDFELLHRCDGIQKLYPSKEERKIIEKYLGKSIIKISHDKLTENQMYFRYKSRFIRQAHWAISNRCNFKCKHCYVSAPHYKEKDLTFNNCCRIVDELASCGIYRLSITGGEPMMRSDFYDILKYVKGKNIIVSEIFTNGSFISDSILSKIKELDINPYFHISYDGEQTHNWIRGVPNAENLVKNAIKLLKNYGFKVNIACCLYKDNINSLAYNIKYFYDLGVDKIEFGLTNEIGEWKKMHGEKTVSIHDVLDSVIQELPEIVEKRLPIDINIAGFFHLSPDFKYSIPEAKMRMSREQLRSWICCESMRNILYIKPNGQLGGCPMLTDTSKILGFPNILVSSLKEILVTGNPFMDFIDRRLNKLEELNEECPNCKFYNTCHGGCRGNAEVLGDFWSKDLIACTFFKKGYYQRIIEIMENYSSLEKSTY